MIVETSLSFCRHPSVFISLACEAPRSIDVEGFVDVVWKMLLKRSNRLKTLHDAHYGTSTGVARGFSSRGKDSDCIPAKDCDFKAWRISFLYFCIAKLRSLRPFVFLLAIAPLSNSNPHDCKLQPHLEAASRGAGGRVA